MERELRESDAGSDPMLLFRRWFEDARRAGLLLAEGMTLATSTKGGVPSARVVLLKEIDDAGFLFYTNLESRKAGELEENPRGALVFWWGALERQVRIEGRVEKLPDEKADAYFRGRPRERQLGAWASHQSRVVSGREELDCRLEALRQDYEGREVPRPPYWGGYRLVPASLEFFQARSDRLNDRLIYHRRGKRRWVRKRLAP